jgi:pilus assembly protein CpaC
MLEVRVAEVSRTLGRELGINMHYTNDGNSFGIGTLDQLTTLVEPDDAVLTGGPLGFLVSDRVNAMFRFNKGSATWTGFIDALKEDGIIKVLAEPTLIALSGQSASFLAGGEFPVPVPQGLGTAAIEWKTYGVLLNFKPVVIGDGKINIFVEPTVSEPDYSLQVVLNGSFIPALKTRTAQTVVELGDGQSFAIAGLLGSSSRSSVAKYPFLGDIPVLGQLFSSRQFQSNETELVIIVTPRLVKPFNQNEQPLPVPTDNYKEPSDLEFFLWGKMEARDSGMAVAKGELEGEFGHAVPPVETMEIEEIEVVE